MSYGLPNEHTFDQGAWAFCARCGTRNPIKNMQWQRGLLLDRRCYDSFPLLGQIDKARADAMQLLVLEPDLQPDPKLTMPTQDGSTEDIFL